MPLNKEIKPNQTLAALVDFAEIRKVTNHIILWNADLAWYSPSATFQIYLHGLEHGLRIHAFRPKRPSGYCTFTFCPTSVFALLAGAVEYTDCISAEE